MKPKAILAGICLSLLGAMSSLALSPEEAKSSRRLVILLDGSLNNPEQAVPTTGTHKLYKPTNILKAYRAVLPVAADGRSQIAYYSEGVGSFIGEPVPFSGLLGFAENLAGGAFGAGFEARIKSAYRFLVANYQPGDEIYVFGFSRGAAEAQGLVRFIDWAHGLLAKDDEYFIVELYEGFSKSISAGVEVETVLDQINHRSVKGTKNSPTCEQQACGASEKIHRQDRHMACGETRSERGPLIKPPRPVEVKFLGVYETVISLGSRVKTEGDVATVTPQFAYLGGKTPAAVVKTARQAISIDERRWDFRPQVWERPANASQSMEQLWFPGVHSNVGGGYSNDGLANAALQWMTAEAMAAGLGWDCTYLGHYRPYVCGDRPDTDTGFLHVAEFFRGKAGNGVRQLPTDAKLHDSVAWLLINDQTYRPQNLLQHLAQDEKRIDQFTDPQLRSGVRAIVEEFKAGKTHQPPPCQARSGKSVDGGSDR
jgi:uncharacterized protein (DUF2235 family)